MSAAPPSLKAVGKIPTTTAGQYHQSRAMVSRFLSSLSTHLHPLNPTATTIKHPAQPLHPSPAVSPSTTPPPPLASPPAMLLKAPPPPPRPPSGPFLAAPP
ncbi:hypothetical protein EX30DRAFT_336973 [Ascodesmis nigricans]|uniref:Uncharacterized protein n=1 Tax=Ascodesmis nigricans TaxID=341454 RepID=A0A4S2N592_9PEZI|nr:hypothetical protein EX30DRAFT_336973 [Ascodesmis nigricans]